MELGTIRSPGDSRSPLKLAGHFNHDELQQDSPDLDVLMQRLSMV
jgi:hypothetical protein